MEMNMGYKSGFVAIIGKPNAGKSTVMNSILGEKIAAVSSKPNTTRNRIFGIHSTEEYQIVFLDTPGIHTPKDKLNKFMVNQAYSAFGEADVICLIVVAGKKPDQEYETMIKHLKPFKGNTMLIINKTDLTDEDNAKQTAEKFNSLYQFDNTLLVSALNPADIEKVENEIIPLLPEQPPYFPVDILTTAPEKDICAEFIREKIFLLTGKELPYSCAVMVNAFEEFEDIINIQADINVERDSQKGMIIGKGGKKIKQIGIDARKDIENLLGVQVYLEIKVKVQKNWSKDEKALERFGYKKSKNPE